MTRRLIIFAAPLPVIGCRWVERQFGFVLLQGGNVVYQRYDAEGKVVEEAPPHFDKHGKHTSPFSE